MIKWAELCGPWCYIEMRKPVKDHSYLRSYLPCLDRFLEVFEVPRGSLEDRLNDWLQKRCVTLLLGIREELDWRIKWIEREVAAQSVWRWVGSKELAESPAFYCEVVIRVAPTAQSAHGARVLPE
jgi:hypothetical protein